MERHIEDDFISEYLRYSAGQESPEMFHIWVAISILASVMERNVWLDRGYYTVYPNMYIILVAGTAKCHKTVAIKMGVNNILKKMLNAPRTFAEMLTKERLVQFLSEGASVKDDTSPSNEEDTGSIITFKATGLVAAPELKTFLGRGALDSGIITVLTDLYDSPDKWSYETKGSGQSLLNNVCINLLGASTATWLRSAIPVESLGGGFISRTLFVYQEEPKELIPFPEDSIPENLSEIKNRLVHDLQVISNIKGHFTFTPEAKEWYRAWYIKDAERTNFSDYSDFFSRWSQFLLKVSMIISIAQNNNLILEKSHLQLAHMHLEAARSTMHPVIDTMTVTDSELPTSKVLGIIRRRETISHEKLSKYTSRFVKSEGLKKIIETLEEAGKIRSVIDADRREYEYIGL